MDIFPFTLHGATYSACVALNKLSMDIHLGVTEEERSIPQAVTVDCKFFFPHLPKACTTDQLNDTICYHDIANAITRYAEGQSFHLLEYMCFSIVNIIEKYINDQTIKIWVKVKKCHPPIAQVESTSFEYCNA